MVVLITGASGGFGSVLGATLVNEGMTVYGTARNPASQDHDRPFPMLAMEVTDAASVEKCVATKKGSGLCEPKGSDNGAKLYDTPRAE